jgi:hypothetical protein
MIAVVAIGVLGLLYTFQRNLIYFPYESVPRARQALPTAEEARFTTEDGLELGAWFMPATGGEPAPAVLVANGNAGNRSHRAPLARELASMGVGVLLFDYRGFGGNSGHPSEEGLRRDARAAREFLAGRDDVDPDRLVYYGESLGAAVALRLAAEHPPAGLVLRSPFTSLAAVGRLHYPWLPVDLLIRDRYESLATVARVEVPLLVIAGEDDEIVPITQSRALYQAAAGPKRFVAIQGAGHNDPELLVGSRVLAEIERFLADIK